MFVIGLTGGIASGKSTVSQMLAAKGAVIIDADKVGHEAFEPGTEAWREVVASFGQGILQPNGQIDRRKLGGIVFGNAEALARLNVIMHPKMQRLMAERLEALENQGVKVAVLEAAVLFEAHWTPLVDEVWVTVVPPTTAVQRLKERNGLTEEQAWARLRSQMTNEERIRLSDVVINTDCPLSQEQQVVDKLWRRMQTWEENPVLRSFALSFGRKALERTAAVVAPVPAAR